MKLRNKKTGEILEEARSSMTYKDKFRIYDIRTNKYFTYNSLAELNEEWEDYEEPDEIWYIDWKGDIRSADIDNEWEGEKQIGNYFLSREEAEKAVEKLKAFKRLKDKGFNFINVRTIGKVIDFDIPEVMDKTLAERKEISDDLTFLFGGEE